MQHDSTADGALDVLVSLADPDGTGRIRERIGVAERPTGVIPPRWTAVSQLSSAVPPASARLWMLEEDRPEINELIVFYAGGLPGALELAVVNGEPFGPDRHATVPLTRQMRERPLRTGVNRLPAEELVPAFRAVTTMRAGRRAANSVAREDWARVVEADAEEPLPGYARWALALRPDCPSVLRERFSDHPSHAHRMRTAGIVEGPAAFVAQWRPARTVLTTLDTGRWAFPTRAREAEDVLRPLVRGSLGTDLEAWAVLAQLLPTFTGTVPELIVTAGAIA
ncbi:hypothetical protein M5362_09600 [Streptomyces sp. Je 1-79]|uniref:hypothetical protein n=1 Tax=Streptomyces sp. Je 1-79 TaxID=2943847 RepID=UPI0021A74599|nr:hypothetical protein [Streptomyces sp. Je 1-79]MCT4353381.1 hypothetical protein [Streptomyces sp. Je 1-79]